MQTQHSYTFGDNDRAAERLYWLSRTFDESTLDYVRRAVSRAPSCLIDLGAGPGFLTRALHRALEPVRSVGLEFSERFVAYGQRDLPSGVELRMHDVTSRLPLSGDLMVARFLLTHLRDPLQALQTWRESEPLLLLLEELVQMSSELPVLQRYYGLVACVQSAAGQDMQIGTRLSALAEDAGFAVESSVVQRLEIPVATMARLHALNLPTLRLQPVVQARYEPAELDAMQSTLEQLANTDGAGLVHVDMARCRAVCA
jgi:SAM-dependent methyltransferase